MKNRPIIVLTGILCASALLAGCMGFDPSQLEAIDSPSAEQQTSAQQPSASQPDNVAASAIDVYFTAPGPSDEFAGLAALVQSIDSAQVSVDMAMYNLSLPEVADALIAAYNRGVRVRVVMESENLGDSQENRLQDAGIPLTGDGNDNGLLHDKFLVIDGQEVWSGTLNLTVSGVEEDRNALLRIRSAELAQAYTAEFEEMFLDHHFGAASPETAPASALEVGDASVQVYFAPEDHVASRILPLVRDAQDSVYILAYSFTSNSLGEALSDLAHSGVTVRGVCDAGRVEDTGAECQGLIDSGLDLRLDGGDGLMHEKIIIIDENTVIVGSYNFTAKADEQNDENLLVIRDANLAQFFVEEFQRVYNDAVH